MVPNCDETDILMDKFLHQHASETSQNLGKLLCPLVLLYDCKLMLVGQTLRSIGAASRAAKKHWADTGVEDEVFTWMAFRIPGLKGCMD